MALTLISGGSSGRSGNALNTKYIPCPSQGLYGAFFARPHVARPHGASPEANGAECSVIQEQLRQHDITQMFAHSAALEPFLQLLFSHLNKQVVRAAKECEKQWRCLIVHQNGKLPVRIR